MAKLYFRYGAMGSSKTANALMVEYNYRERGKRALLLKPRIDERDGKRIIKSRIGLEHSCMFVEEFTDMSDEQICEYDCIIVDEAQFCTKKQVMFFLHVVDELDISVICYGLRTDFKMELFEGAKALLAWADVIEELRTVCWCGRGASCNARISPDGKVIRDGEQVLLGGNDKYIALCRKHFKEGKLFAVDNSTSKCDNGNVSGVYAAAGMPADEQAKVSPFVEDSSDEDTADIDPRILSFLEADTYSEKLELFRGMASDITDEMIDTIAIALDTQVRKGPINQRIQEIINLLVVQEKFEDRRLRQ